MKTSEKLQDSESQFRGEIAASDDRHNMRRNATNERSIVLNLTRTTCHRQLSSFRSAALGISEAENVYTLNRTFLAYQRIQLAGCS